MADRKKEKPRYNMWQNTAWMIGLAWKHMKSVLGLCVALAGISIGMSLVQLFIAPTILQQVEAQASAGQLLGSIAFFALALMLLAGLQEYVNANTLFGRTYIRSNVILGMIRNKSMATSYPNLENTHFQECSRRATGATNDTSASSQAIWDTLTGLLINVTGFAIYLWLLSDLQMWMVAAVAITSMAAYVVNRIYQRWQYARDEETKADTNQQWHLLQSASGMEKAKDIRIYKMQKWLTDAFCDALRRIDRVYAHIQRMGMWVSGTDVLMALLRNGMAYAYLIAQVIDGSLTVPRFLLYFGAVTGFGNWVTGILNDLAALNRQSHELDHIRTVLEYPEPFRFEGGRRLAVSKDTPCRIELRDVSFRYPEAEQYTLRHINLTIEPGEKVAIVGLNGAGKTTLVKLICGMYDPTEGQVLFNGEDIRQFDRRDYYEQFSAVFQNFSILNVTLAETVAQSTTVDMEKVKRCVEYAGLTKKARSLPDGYHTYIGKEVFDEGEVLSGGEIQRLMLARALYKDGPVLVLDEPTAALDPIAESDLYQKYHEMTQKRTSVYISHRLASTRFCDRILFLENGGIAEEGSHADLMKQEGRYACLYNVQSQYYQEGEEAHE